MNSVEITCKCGERKFWLSDGQITRDPCPNCGRKYKGVYNPKTLQIEAKEIGQMKVGDIQITIKINDGNAPKMLRALVFPIKVWAWFERAICRISCRKPCQINIIFKK